MKKLLAFLPVLFLVGCATTPEVKVVDEPTPEAPMSFSEEFVSSPTPSQVVLMALDAAQGDPDEWADYMPDFGVPNAIKEQQDSAVVSFAYIGMEPLTDEQKDDLRTVVGEAINVVKVETTEVVEGDRATVTVLVWGADQPTATAEWEQQVLAEGSVEEGSDEYLFEGALAGWRNAQLTEKPYEITFELVYEDGKWVPADTTDFQDGVHRFGPAAFGQHDLLAMFDAEEEALAEQAGGEEQPAEDGLAPLEEAPAE